MSHRGGRGRYNRPSYNRMSHQNNYSQPAYTTQPGYSTPQKQSVPEPTTPSQPPQQQQQTPQQPQQQQTPQQPQQQQTPQQQQQNQQQHHTPSQQQQQQQQPKPMAVQQPQQQQQTPPQQSPQPAVEKTVQEPHFANNQSSGMKQETENQQQVNNTTSGSEDVPIDSEGSGGGEVRRKYKPWMKRGSLGIKISRRIKKRRQNARLRNILAPKNAMMVLHELHPELKMTISEQPNAANQMGYTVEIEIDGKIYRGHGMSKICAKQAGSENALKAVLLEKLEQNNVKLTAESLKGDSAAVAAAAAAAAAAWDEDAEMTSVDQGNDQASNAGGDANKDGSDGANKSFGSGRQIQEDDVPWGSLASFALYKLFSEWQSQGFQLPASSGLPAVFQRAGVPLPYPKKLLPEDASKKHPVQLLNQIRPGCQYIESREGMPPNLTFTFSVVVDGQTFTGVGTNKKDAKKECAKHALEAMGVKYD